MLFRSKMKTRTGRLWTYVRDDQPFGGSAAPAAVYFYSPDRCGEHPEWHLAGYTGILQADAYAGFNTVYKPDRKPGPIVEAGCWSHYLERIFIWSRRGHRQHPPMTAARQTPHKNRSQSERLQEGEEVRLGLPWLGICWLYP